MERDRLLMAAHSRLVGRATLCTSLVTWLAACGARPVGGSGDGGANSGTSIGNGTSAATSAESGTGSGGTGGGFGCEGFPAGSVYVVPALADPLVGDDALGALSGVRCIDGSIEVKSVTNLEPLSSLERVTLDLYIHDSVLTTLAPLSQLKMVGRVLWLNRLDQLKDLQGLETLESVEELEIGRFALSFLVVESPAEGNDALMDISALDGLVVDEVIRLGDNAALSSLTGLPTTAPHVVSITLNPGIPVTQVDAYISQLLPGTEIIHCGNFGDEPCEMLPPN